MPSPSKPQFAYVLVEGYPNAVLDLVKVLQPVCGFSSPLPDLPLQQAKVFVRRFPSGEFQGSCIYTYIQAAGSVVASAGLSVFPSPYAWLWNELATILPPVVYQKLRDDYNVLNREQVQRHRKGLKHANAENQEADFNG